MRECGIYRITCLPTGQVYVGSAVYCFTARWKGHIRSLNTCKHSNRELQKDWLHFGEAAFEFAVIEKIDPALSPPLISFHDITIKREYYWMAQYHKAGPCYNPPLPANRCPDCGGCTVWRIGPLCECRPISKPDAG